MVAKQHSTRSHPETGSAGVSHAPETADVVVFVEESLKEAGAIRHAQKVARAFGGKVMVVHVMCGPANGSQPVDPVDWNIRKQKTLKWLEQLSRSASAPDQDGDVRLLEGQCINQIQAMMEDHQGDISAALRPRIGQGWQQSQVASGVLLSHSAAILMIPEAAAVDTGKTYARILVPLDGSARAEAALPMATVLAQAENAELMLCHIAPEPGLTEFGVKDQEAERLHALVSRKNEQAARAHLTRIRNNLAHNGLKISTRIIKGNDVRRELVDMVKREGADILVMATHGQSGHRDVPTGDVARFVLDRADIPVLMVRHRTGRQNNHAFGKLSSVGVRQPAGTD